VGGIWLDLTQERGLGTAPPATPADIAAAEAAVGCGFPASLRDLLQATDGLRDEYGVFMWDHEGDSRTAVAFGLGKHVRGDFFPRQG